MKYPIGRVVIWGDIEQGIYKHQARVSASYHDIMTDYTETEIFGSVVKG